MADLRELNEPSINAALVQALTVTGKPLAKASGTIVRAAGELYLLTNWHVVTGRRWFAGRDLPADWLEVPRWQSEGKFAGSPDMLDILIPLSGGLKRLVRLKLEDPEERGESYWRHLAWRDGNSLVDLPLDMPGQDLVCMHLGRDAVGASNHISVVSGTALRLGYEWRNSGLSYGPALADRVFVVGYPRHIGTDRTDPPVWTSGTIATEPQRDWNGERFLIDARTREGQSGSAVIAYRSAGGGLGPNHQLLGIYSGRIDEKADIGSAWRVDQLLENLETGQWRPRRRAIDDSVEYILHDIEADPKVETPAAELYGWPPEEA